MSFIKPGILHAVESGFLLRYQYTGSWLCVVAQTVFNQWRSQGGCLGGLSTPLFPEYKAYHNVKALVYYFSPCKDIVCIVYAAVIRVQSSTVGGVVKSLSMRSACRYLAQRMSVANIQALSQGI